MATPQSPEQRAIADLGGGEPGFEGGYRTEIGLPRGQPYGCSVCLLIVFAPRQKQGDVIFVAGQRRDIEPRQFRRPQRRGETDQDQGAVAPPGKVSGMVLIAARNGSSTSAVFLRNGRRWARRMPAKVADTRGGPVGGG